MKECIKCGQDKVSITYMAQDAKVYWSEHNTVDNISRFTKNDRYYHGDRIEKDCLVFKCDTCGYQRAENTKDNKQLSTR